MKHDKRERFEVIKVGGREENVARKHARTHSRTAAAGPSSNNTSGALLRNPSGHTLQTLQQYYINTHTIT